MIALLTLVAIRIGDAGRLRWGQHFWWSGGCYHIDLRTMKTGSVLHGPLHQALTPFLDAVLLRGVDPAYLDDLRARAETDGAAVFRSVAGRALRPGRFSKVWRKQLGAGAHIARARIHTELGRLGPAGVTAALACCGQEAPETRRHYQGAAVARAELEASQELVDELAHQVLDGASDRLE